LVQRTIRVMTWNIHGRRGPDRPQHLARVVDVIKSHNPDILAVQELDSRACAPNEPMPLAYLSEALGEHRAEARTIVAGDGHYGHAVISRWPLSNVKVHDITHGRWEPRNVIETDIETPYGLVNFSAVHLGLWFTERRWQAQRLAEIAASHHPVSIMLGDFNDWPWRGPVRRLLAAALPSRTHHRTFPSSWPILLLDRVYCRPKGALVSSWVDPAGRLASDHLPVFADIAIPS
jgi:endonuclease/exonuclease/phosphatase family metal-dependent hydrolase